MLHWTQQMWDSFKDGVLSFAAFLIASGIILSRFNFVKEWWTNMRLRSCPNRDMVLANFGETIITRCEKAIIDNYLPSDMRNRINRLSATYAHNKGNDVVVVDYVARAMLLPEDAPDFRTYEGPERRKNGVHI